MNDLTPWAPPASNRIRLSDESARVRVNAVRAQARYDAAQTTDENRNTFAAADPMSADAANNPGVRMILRNRCRYVFANNPRAKGMLKTLGKHTVGTGPRLQMLLGDGPAARRLATKIETGFHDWARAVAMAKKLRTLRVAKAVSGEGIALKTFNPRLASPVRLDIKLFETDRLMSPWGLALGELEIDGIRFDEFGNRTHYQILREHPGDFRMAIDPSSFTAFRADLVGHYFEEDRPEQERGIPEITPAVQVFEEGRRFRAAVLAAAETAADFAMAIQSDAPANAEDPDELDPMDIVALQRRMATVLPAGWKIAQTKPEQPIANFKEFSRELLCEIARCIDMPLTIASLDAGDANMSAHYVVDQTYANAIEIERSELERVYLDPWLDSWLTLAVDPAVGLFKRIPKDLPHCWYWPSIGRHADPAKVATAQEKRLRNRTTTYSAEFAKEGKDWEAEFRQLAKEKALMRELGLDEPDVQTAPAGGANTHPNNTKPAKPGADPDDDEDDADEADSE